MRFISSGLKIHPDETISPMMIVEGPADAKVEFSIVSYFGNFEGAPKFRRSVIKKDGERKFVIETAREFSLQELNAILKGLVYTVRVYDARPVTDYVTVHITGEINCKVAFPIEIARRPMPVLTFRANDHISDKVTIVLKTMMRYECLKNS